MDFAAGKAISLFVFVLSYTVDRIQKILDTLESTPDIIPRLSGVIITPKACGESGKCATIWSIKEALGVSDLKTALIDGNAEVLEECNQWLSSEEFSGIHIKLKRKGSLSEEVKYPNCKFLEHAVPETEHFLEQ